MARPSERPDGSGKTGSDELARVVRERRESLGWTRQQLADATGIPYPTIAQIETAYRGVSPSRLGVIARVLGLDPKELYDVLASEGEAARTGGPAVGPAGAGEERSALSGCGFLARQSGFRGRRPGVAGRATRPGPSRRPPTRWPALGAQTGRADQRPPDVIDQVVELLSGLPSDERLEALSRVQNVVLDRIVQERIEGAERST